MSPEANLLRLAYIDINALLVEGFDTNAQDVVDMYRKMQDPPEIVKRSSGYWIVNSSGVVDCDLTIKQPYLLMGMAQQTIGYLEEEFSFGSVPYGVAKTLTEIRDLLGADKI